MALPLLYGDEPKYRKVLEDCVEAIQESDKRFEQVGVMNMPDRLRIATQVMVSPDKARLSLVFPEQNAGEDPEEVVLRLQGYVVQAHLPPILNRKQLGKVFSQARQSITLSGLGTETFNEALLALLKIHQYFRDNCVDGQVDNWVARKDRGHPIVTAGNRYLTQSTEDQPNQRVLSLDDIDPLQVLRKAVPEAHYTSENEVLYFERVTKSNKTSYQTVRPMAIRVGQLVEVQLGFTSVRVKKGRYVFLPILRSICILDRTLLDDMTKATLDQLCTNNSSSSMSLKRRVGYQENDVEGSMSTQMKRLRMDGVEEMDVTEQEM